MIPRARRRPQPTSDHPVLTLSSLNWAQEDAERSLLEKAEAEAAEVLRKKREERFGVVEQPKKKAEEAAMEIDFLERPVDAAARAHEAFRDRGGFNTECTDACD